MVLGNGTVLRGLISATISADCYLGANRFYVQSAIEADPGLDWTALPLTIDVQAILGGTASRLIYGEADSLHYDPISRILCVEGRDLTARFLGKQTQITYQNQTSEEIATSIAAAHGLTANVAKTTAVVGRYFSDNHTRSALYQYAKATSDWDILIWIAQQEGFDVWVEDTTLNFQPPQADGPSFVVTPADCTNMSLVRDNTIAGGIDAHVQSWNCQAGESIASNVGGGPTDNSIAMMQLVKPNLQAAQADQIAQQAVTVMTQHGKQLYYSMPADVTTKPRILMQLVGTDSVFDDIYKICSVERRFSVDGGYVQHVEAKVAQWINS